MKYGKISEKESSDAAFNCTRQEDWGSLMKIERYSLFCPECSSDEGIHYDNKECSLEIDPPIRMIQRLLIYVVHRLYFLNNRMLQMLIDSGSQFSPYCFLFTLITPY